MTSDANRDVPEDVRTLLAGYIHTFDQLETLLLLRRDPTKEWTAQSVGDELKVDPAAATEALHDLHRRDFLDMTSQPPNAARRYRYSPGNRSVDELVARLAQVYDDSRLEIMRLMSTNAIERLRTSAVKRFADAFVVRKKTDE